MQIAPGHILLEDYLKKSGLTDRIEVESSGVNVYSEGQRACENIRTVSAQKGTPFDHYSCSFKRSDLAEYDLILAMDKDTMQRIKQYAKKSPPKGEIRFFRDFDTVKDNSREVPDPWYGSEDQAELVFEMINRALRPIVDSVM